MNFREFTISLWPAPRPVPNVRYIVLPLDIILYMSYFQNFDNYRNFIRSLWPNNDEDGVIRDKLRKLSTYQATTKFINGKEVPIEYNFDSERPEEDRILYNWKILNPIFGRVVPQEMNDFINLAQLQDFITVHVNLNLCSKGVHASCPCHLREDGQDLVEYRFPPDTSCPVGHFHHCCSQHVNYWWYYYLDTEITREQADGPLDDGLQYIWIRKFIFKDFE